MHVDRFTNEKARFEFLIFRVISWIASGRQKLDLRNHTKPHEKRSKVISADKLND